MANLLQYPLLLGISLILVQKSLSDQGWSQYCDKTCSKMILTRYDCGFWGWRACYSNRIVQYICQGCCPGYGGNGCLPQCGGGFTTSACQRNEGRQIYQTWNDIRIVTNSGGQCVAPMKCIQCNYGYYADSDGFCRACRQIPDCFLKSCSAYASTVCDRCDGEWQSQKPGRNAFTSNLDKTKCRRTCSWRNGFRCFPGTCTGDLLYPTDCKCAHGFSGKNCAEANKDGQPKILIQELKLKSNAGGPSVFMDIPTYEKKVWTNENRWTTVSISVTSSFKLNIDSQSIPPYIDNYTIGIDSINIVALLQRSNVKANIIIDKTCGYETRCSSGFNDTKLQATTWNDILDGGFPTPFSHQDSINFSVAVKNGGYVDYRDWDDRGAKKSYFITGYKTINFFEMEFDFVKPYHCYETRSFMECTSPPAVVHGYTQEQNITVKWGDWKDDDSGLLEVVISIYTLEAKGATLHPGKMKELRLNYTDKSNTAFVAITDRGPHAVDVTIYDWANNYKTARRIVVFDDRSKVDLQGKSVSVKEENGLFWINDNTRTLTLTWADRFINKDHDTNKWLAEVIEDLDVSTDLDDIHAETEGSRGIDAIHNINGIVRVDIAKEMTTNNQTTRTDFKSVTREEFDKQTKIFYDEDLIDGKSITFIVRGIDCMESYAEDNITVMIDLSPPVISNLWLTKGDIRNISVHSTVELQNLTIEWEMYDPHSGINSVFWRLYDNFTGTEIEYGNSTEHAQGETETLIDCQEKYGSKPRGHTCYCTPYSGCYHSHYQIKPAVTLTGQNGLRLGNEIGIHDYDYFIEVTATNNAGLQTVQNYKITVDTSPPHEGSVHEGIPGQPEIDFQQSFNINAHWDGFFDKESGVWFYMYGFAKRCLSKDDLDVHTSVNGLVFKTFELEASFTVSGPGTYYTTVMAYNHALDNSQPVCSDGVTVDSEVPTVSEVVANGARTAKGLVKDDLSGLVYLLHKNREIELVEHIPTNCLHKITTVSHLRLTTLPHRRLQNGTESLTRQFDCAELNQIQPDIPAYITPTGHLDISWNATGIIHDFEVGLSSQNSDIPDIMNFVTSHHHQHIRLYHPDVFNGEMFYVVLRAITRSDVQTSTIVGGFLVDSTSPMFNGNVSVRAEETPGSIFLIASWNADSFQDQSDPNPLNYEIAIGTVQGGKDVLPFQPIKSGGNCILSIPPTCAAISSELLPWNLHGEQSYFVSVKAENTAGLSIVASSEEYFHYIIKASTGVVYDIDIEEDETFVDLTDIDFQPRTDQVSVRWSGFSHPHESVRFYVCLTEINDGSYLVCSGALSEDTSQFTFSGLTLRPYQTYYQTVICETKAGNVTAVSDGITVVTENDYIDGIVVYDGPDCKITNNTDVNVETSHHSEDKRLVCVDDVDYQLSLNRLQAHWFFPAEKKFFLKDIFWAVEERAPFADIWTMVKSFERWRTFTPTLEENNLHLYPGTKYRIALKLCAYRYCFQPVYSNGVMCIPHPPVPGTVSLHYDETVPELNVVFEPFRDSDILDEHQALAVMDHYEWALTDSSNQETLLTKWQRASTTKSYFKNELLFTVPLNGTIVFTKCWKLSVRGYTKVGSSAVVSPEIRNCSELREVKPAIVIDAIGEIENKDTSHVGKPISLEENENWKEKDADFTPFSNIISAVWPTLRHRNYSWAVLKEEQNDPTIFYKDSTHLNLTEPCSHPEAIKCGQTDKEYVNVDFGSGELRHGRRYIVCIHAEATTLRHEFWNQELVEVNACSDGITVDLTPPVPADVWIGYDKNYFYQTSTTDMAINWNSFIDVDEGGIIAHSSGVTGYHVAIGTSSGGVDVVPFTKVGLTNHKTFHNLSLQSGHTYYATVKAVDFTEQSSQSTSDGVKVDTSPPDVTDQVVKITARHVTETAFVEACWKGVFVDDQSGISHYSWAVGTSKGYDDIMPFVDTEEECGNNPEDIPLDLSEGHAYFINVKGFNNAGLYSMMSSWAFIVDESPPTPGLVCDGPVQKGKACSDVDYIDNTTILNVHWTDFFEPHSSIMDYYISIGSCPTCDDVLLKQPVGITNNIAISMLSFAQGEHYFVTVTACNTAELCSSSSSDGFVVDSTPPIAGVVQDGTLDSDIQYQASRNHIGCKWYGFVDPQSEISHYVWRVGTAKGEDDIFEATDVHANEEAFVFDLQSETGSTLPLNSTMYCTVRAYNKAGMFVESSSNGFSVDETYPNFTLPLSLAPIGSAVPRTSVLRSTLKILWDVQDEESFIETQYLSITSHIGGDFNLSAIKVEGIIRDYTFTGLRLHDGSYYDITLHSCNGAKLCSTSKITNVLIDSTPPTPGTFAINTDHAASLKRQPDDWMTWTSISVNLAWLGFEDLHTGVDRYIVNVGSTFMDNDLNEIPYMPMTVNHNSNASFIEDGFVQTHSFRTQVLSKYKSIYINIRAVNKVGLSSDVVHSKFELVFGGVLDLVRRCDSHTCLGHCVCAPHGELCPEQKDCNNVTGGDQYADIGVRDYLNLAFPASSSSVSYTADNTFLAAHWYIKDDKGARPKWYEWSVGESFYEAPKGIFEQLSERVWHMSGKEQRWIFTTKRGKTLEEDEKYSFFVRAWYDENTFAIFKSPGIRVSSRPPALTSIRGRAVKEVLGDNSKDVDFITKDTEVFADWKEKFLNTNNYLSHFHVYISTSPGGHDMQEVAKDVSSAVTRISIAGIQYAENTKYYTVVQAYNHAGLHATVTSDGFMLDEHSPSTGLVHHGLGPLDVHATNVSNRIQLRWHGFSDAESGIQYYRYCVFLDIAECDYASMINEGITTRVEYKAPIDFPQGASVKGGVQAVDVVGRISVMIVSDGVVVDTTPPVRIKTISYGDNVIFDHSFENAVNVSQCSVGYTKWNISGNSCAYIIQTSGAEDGISVLHLQGVISQPVSVNSFGKYRLTFYTSVIPSDRLYLSATEGYVKINDKRFTFLMYTKQTTKSYAWQKHTFYFNVKTNWQEVTFGTASAYALDDVKLQQCVQSSSDFHINHVTSHVVFVHDWSSLHAEWSFLDDETEIVDYQWAIGTVRGGTQLQDFTSVGRRTFAHTSALRLEQNTDVYVTVVAENTAELRTVSYSDPVTIDLTPPVFFFVHDGPLFGQDLDYQKELSLVSHWKVEDPESGIKECFWAIGIFPGDVSVQGYVQVDAGSNNASKDFTSPPSDTLYVTIKCTNGGGLATTRHSDGVKILRDPPDTDDVILELMTSSETQFPPRGTYHGNSSEIKFRWTGFYYSDGIGSYEIALGGNGRSISEIVKGSTFGYSYASFTGLDLTDGRYTVYVTGINEVKMFSQKVTADFYLLTDKPKLSGLSIKTSYDKTAHKATASWRDVFTSEHPLFYEVTAKLLDGQGDIVQWQETDNTYIELNLHEDIISSGAIRFGVRAVNYAGLFELQYAELYL